MCSWKHDAGITNQETEKAQLSKLFQKNIARWIFGSLQKKLSHLPQDKIKLPAAFTTLCSCPPKIALSSEGTKLCVLTIADLFFLPTVSQASSAEEETTIPSFESKPLPLSFSSSSCTLSMAKLKNS
jgi:hypothetical protein